MRLPYIAGWHQAPAREGRDLARLHLQLTSVLRAPGKLKYLAGSESGMGAWVNDTTPERIAARLRAIAATPSSVSAAATRPAAASRGRGLPRGVRRRRRPASGRRPGGST